MFDVGFTELMLIGVVSLVVIGPERLPAVARTVGTYVGKLQRFVTGVKRDIRHELESGELKDLIGDQKQQIDELRKMVNTTRRDLEKDTRDVVAGARKKFAEVETSAKGAGTGSTPASGPGASLDKDDPTKVPGSAPGPAPEPAKTPVTPSIMPPGVVPPASPAASMTDRVPGTPVAPAVADAAAPAAAADVPPDAADGRSRASGG